jgi:hypothetical protein
LSINISLAAFYTDYNMSVKEGQKRMFGLHSLRNGGATQAANNNVYDRLFKAHSL